MMVIRNVGKVDAFEIKRQVRSIITAGTCKVKSLLFEFRFGLLESKHKVPRANKLKIIGKLERAKEESITGEYIENAANNKTKAKYILTKSNLLCFFQKLNINLKLNCVNAIKVRKYFTE